MREDIPVAIAQTPPALTSAFVLVSPYSYSASFDGLVNPTRSEYEYIFPCQKVAISSIIFQNISIKSMR